MHDASKWTNNDFSELPALGACLCHGDAITLLEIIQDSLSCDTEEGFSKLILKIQQLFPFDFAGALMGGLTAPNELVIVGGINISFPEEWLREYSEKNYFHLDIVTKETFRKCQTCHWSYIMPGSAEIVPREIMTLNLDLGMKECYTHGTKAIKTGQDGSFFCFSGPSIKRDLHTIVLMDYLLPHLHQAFSRIWNKENHLKPNINLSRREKEVLNWLKEGKSSWDISIILDISERTVNYHVYNIMQKLEVVNRAQALAVALGMGLIDIF